MVSHDIDFFFPEQISSSHSPFQIGGSNVKKTIKICIKATKKQIITSVYFIQPPGEPKFKFPGSEHNHLPFFPFSELKNKSKI